jgi:hypothetical protein
VKYLVFKIDFDVFTGAQIHFLMGVFDKLEDAEDSRYGRKGGFIQEVPDSLAKMYEDALKDRTRTNEQKSR